MRGLVRPFVKAMGGWQEVIDKEFGFDVNQLDCALEQWWAIREGLA